MWISVKDKLPTLNKEVLVVSYTNDYYIAWRSHYDDVEEWNSDEGAFEDDYITHWQQLPPLPQDEQQIETEIDIKQGISEVLAKAEELNPYKVYGVLETYSQYNQGWCDAVDYIARMLGVDY